MEKALRSHRGGTVLALGILGLLAGLSVSRLGLLGLPALILAITFGVLAWRKGSEDLKAMNAGQVDASGRSLTQLGRDFGIASCLVGLAVTILGLLMVSRCEFRQSEAPGSGTYESDVRLIPPRSISPENEVRTIPDRELSQEKKLRLIPPRLVPSSSPQGS